MKNIRFLFAVIALLFPLSLKARATSYPLPSGIAKDTPSVTIYVEFKVDVDGIIKDVKLLRTDPAHCDTCSGKTVRQLQQEALRIVTSMPPWEPRKNKRGKPVAIVYTLPITVKLE